MKQSSKTRKLAELWNGKSKEERVDFILSLKGTRIERRVAEAAAELRWEKLPDGIQKRIEDVYGG